MFFIKVRLLSLFSLKWLYVVALLIMFVLTLSLIKAEVSAKRAENISNNKHLDFEADSSISAVISNMQIELGKVHSNEISKGSYLTNSQSIIRQNIIKLADLLPAYPNKSHALLDSFSGLAQKCLLIAMGLTQDSSVHHRLREISLEESDPNLKELTVRALMGYKDTADVSVFIIALSDTFNVTILRDSGIVGEDLHQKIFPIRSVAKAALIKLGYDVSLKDGKYEVSKRK